MIRRNKSEKEQTKLEKRIASMDTDQLTRWLDQALFTIGRNVSDWASSREPAYINEAHSGAEVLHLAVAELKRRADATRNL
jgi:hypothetical protein